MPTTVPRPGLPVTLHRPGRLPTPGKVQSVDHRDGTANIYAFVGWPDETATGEPPDSASPDPLATLTGWNLFTGVPERGEEAMGDVNGLYWVDARPTGERVGGQGKSPTPMGHG